jgi:2-polyprenyl-3-methyl-5-hydroxy-6-metoxy-1,4-benzoquinol methylase
MMRRGSQRTGALLLTTAGAGFARAYRNSRIQGRAATAEHIARMRRLREDVLQHFYMSCIASMEVELEAYPAYDRRKHELRYEIVSELAAAHAPPGGTVVDVGCASALVLDRVHSAQHTKGVGFDLAPYGLHERHRRPEPPVLAQAVVEHIPLPDECADVVVFSEVIEHLIDPFAGMREVGRITRPQGIVVLTTNNGSEMPIISPLRDPLTWCERLLGRWWPEVLAFRNITWHEPINREADPLPDEAPTYAPHFHFSFRELRDLAADAGLEVICTTSFEYPAPQSPFADHLRRLTERSSALGERIADGLERLVSRTPGLSLMGTHHLIVLRRVRRPLAEPRTPWWPARLIDRTALRGAASRPPAHGTVDDLVADLH